MTADTCATCGTPMDWHDGRCPTATEVEFAREWNASVAANVAPPAPTTESETPHPDTERADYALTQARRTAETEREYAKAAEERARTAEAEVERLRSERDTAQGAVSRMAAQAKRLDERHTTCHAERDAARAEATATREAVARVRALCDEYTDGTPAYGVVPIWRLLGAIDGGAS